MSVFESDIEALSRLEHPHIEEFDAWLEDVDKTALSLAVEETLGSHSIYSGETAESPEMFKGLLELTPDLIAAAKTVSEARGDTSRGALPEVEVAVVSSWIPVEQRQKELVRRKKEPHYKAWRPKSSHTPVLASTTTLEEVAPRANNCIDAKSTIFESQTTANIRMAKSICARCTSVIECRDKAVSTGDFKFSQAGMSAAELKAYSENRA